MSKVKELIQKYRFRFDSDGYFVDCFIPKEVAQCPNCSRPLEASADAWTFDEKENAFPEDIKVHCVKFSCNNADTLANRMPYVFWLPETTKAAKWVNDRLRDYYYPPPPTQAELEALGQQNFLKEGVK